MEQDQGTTAENLARLTNEPSWNELVGVDRLAMTINVEGRFWLVRDLLLWRPEVLREACQGVSQSLTCINTGEARSRKLPCIGNCKHASCRSATLILLPCTNVNPIGDADLPPRERAEKAGSIC